MLRRALCTLLLALSLLPATAMPRAEAPAIPAASILDSLLTEAYRHIGKRYRYGSMGDQTFDCSGFTLYVFGRCGYTLPHSSGMQAEMGTAVEREDLMPGDLVMFSGRRISHTRIGHVGLVVEVDREQGTFRFIHACSRGIMVSDFPRERYYTERYICARRILPPEALHDVMPADENRIVIPEPLFRPLSLEIARTQLPKLAAKNSRRIRTKTKN